MKQVSVTYKAPPGDAKVTEAFGYTFFDGKEETIVVDERSLEKLQANRYFKCGEPQDADEAPDPEKERAEAAAAIAADKAKRAAQGLPTPPEELPTPPEEEEAGR